MDTDDVLALMQEVAAEVITPRFQALAHGEVMEKNPGDLVTVADREAEELLTKALLADDPNVLVVGEEAASANPSLVQALPGAEHAYTIDPVDGTKNFVNGSPHHAVMIAELRGGEPVRAWIWQPEHGVSYTAERGAGVERNGQRLSRPQPPDTASQVRALTSRPQWEGPHGPVVLQQSAWCCGVDYPWLAEGTVDAIMYTRCLPWDHAPGSLLVTETGGVVRHGDGTIFRPDQLNPAGILAAASPQVWDLIAEDIVPLFP